MAAFFARAFLIGSNIVESAAAGSDGVGPTVAGSSAGAGLVDGGFFITSVIFGGVPVGGAFGNLDAFLEGEGGQSAAFLLRARVRGIVGWWWW